MTEYIVLECFNGYVNVCNSTEGYPIIFSSLEDATKYAKENCQKGKVVEY